MKLTKLIKTLDNPQFISKGRDFKVKGIACNSKEVFNGFLFVAIDGAKEDGHKFIPEAIRKGAKAVIVQRQVSGIKGQDKINLIKVEDSRRALAKLAAEFYDYPSQKIKVVGITGTNGKTTVSYLLEAILKEAGRQTAVIGTISYRFKNKVIPARNTTPPPIELQSLLMAMAKAGMDYAIMEVSSHALDQQRVAGIDFHSAIFTNLTQDHLDYHRTKENYFRAKSRLFKDLGENSFAVINQDDKYARRLKKLTRAKPITYGIRQKAEVRLEDIKMALSHTKLVLSADRFKSSFKVRLIGLHNVYNILAAVAWALKEGINIEIIRQALQKFSFVPGRLERINFKGNFSVFVDYAHTPDALYNVLKTLRRLPHRRLIAVFGCGGERDKSKRPKMGRVVSELADYVVVTSDNPRSEDPRQIIRDIQRGIKGNHYCVIPERFQAIRKAISLAKSLDIVLIAGKGHERYQILKDRELAFSDQQVVKKCLQSLNC